MFSRQCRVHGSHDSMQFRFVTYFDDAMKFNSSHSLLLFFPLILSSALHFSRFFFYSRFKFCTPYFLFLCCILLFTSHQVQPFTGERELFWNWKCMQRAAEKIYQETHWRKCELWTAKKRRRKQKYAEEMGIYHPDEGKNYAKMRGRASRFGTWLRFLFFLSVSPHLLSGRHSKNLWRKKKFMFSFTIFNFNFVMNQNYVCNFIVVLLRTRRVENAEKS